MGYRVIYETGADKVRKSLPLGAKAALTVRMRQIATDPYKHSKPYGAGTDRSTTFGLGRGLAVFRVEQRVLLVTVIDMAHTG